VLDRSSDWRVIGGDPNIGHISIDKSSRLHARAISEVLAVIKGHAALPLSPFRRTHKFWRDLTITRLTVT
jgi:hypothetical protein